MSKTYTCIRPAYIREFRCDGSTCKSRCCGDWRITVDEATLRKYSRMEPKEEGQEILSRIIYRKPLQSFGIAMEKNGRCPFLGEDYLCSIQKRYGEEFISDICATYPRVFYQVGEVLEESLAVTCPVAEELILFSGKPIRFEKVSMPLPRRTQIAQWTDKVASLGGMWLRIQEISLGILQDRKYPMDERFLRLLHLLDRLDCMEPEDIPSRLEALADEAFPLTGGSNFSTAAHVRFLAGVFAKLYPMELTEGKIVSLQKCYEEASDTFLSELMKLYGDAMENYLVNEFFLRLYPFAFSGPLLYNGKIFIIGCKLVELSLILAAFAHGGKLRKKEFLQCIARISERLDHNSTGMTVLRDSVPKGASAESVSEFAAYMLAAGRRTAGE